MIRQRQSKESLSLFVLFFAFLASASPSRAEENFKPIGPEAFQVLTAIYDYDDKIPLDARVVELRDGDETVRRKIVFRSTRGFMVPGYLEFPKSAKPPYPLVLLMHGWSGSKDAWWENGNYISGGDARQALLEKGIAVFALDAQGHGDRIAENDYHVVNLYNDPDNPGRKNYFNLQEIITQTVVDYRRGLDYLAARADVDMKRIGLLGYSMGGFHAVALTAVEPCVKLAVGCVVPVSWRENIILHPANYAQGIGDRPFALCMGRTDPLCDEPNANALYKLIESPHTKLFFYDAGHRLPVAHVQDAVPFIADRL